MIEYDYVCLKLNHSPFIVSDLPAENIIRMKKEDNNSVKFEQYSESKKSFGANYVDIIQTGFFDNELLMGSFAHEVIKMLSLAEKNDILGENFKWNKDTKNAKKYIQNEENRGNIKRMKNEI